MPPDPGWVAALWRHPIKSIGRESLAETALPLGGAMPFDRAWALRHSRSKIDPTAPTWGKKANFLNGMRHPALAAVSAGLEDGTGRMTLSHPALDAITLDLALPADRDRLIAWIAGLIPDDSPQPDGVIALPDRGLTDSDWPGVSLINLASHRAVAGWLRQEIAAERWRCNIWLDGLEPWAERDLIGRTVAIGGARLLIREHIGRCLQTAANTVTGLRDSDTLAALTALVGAKDFGVFAEVTQAGRIRAGDAIEVIA